MLLKSIFSSKHSSFCPLCTFLNLGIFLFLFLSVSVSFLFLYKLTKHQTTIFPYTDFVAILNLLKLFSISALVSRPPPLWAQNPGGKSGQWRRIDHQVTPIMDNNV